MRPVILNTDDSVGPLESSVIVPLPRWREALRFACGLRLLREFGRALDVMLPDDSGTVFIGSGDFHHLSLPLIEGASARHGPLEVVIFDNHPDTMRYPFGIHCGSWVGHLVALPRVAHIHVVGITSADIGSANAWAIQLKPLLSRRVTFWSIGVNASWAKPLSVRRAFRDFSSASDMLEAFYAHIAASALPIYLSIDKDVLSVEDARTNWDQGCMRERELLRAIEQLRGRIVGSDVTGEVSVPEYSQNWKRFLVNIDKQPLLADIEIDAWQSQQHALNQRLLGVISNAYAPVPSR